MILDRLTKIAVAAVATTVVAGGAALALTVGTGDGDGSVSRRSGRALNTAVLAAPTVDGVVVAGASGETQGAASSMSAGASRSGSSTGARAAAGTESGAGQAGAGWSTGIVGPSGAGGASGGAAGGSGGGTAGGSSTGGGSTGGGSTGGGSTGSNPGSNPGGGSGSQPGEKWAPPAVPSDVSLYREGSHTVTVPGTPAVAKKLCLSGEVNRCRTIRVPAVQGVSMTVSYSGNASASAPSFKVFPCAGGLGVTVTGITPGTHVTVEAEGVTLSATLTDREVSQSASLCDA